MTIFTIIVPIYNEEENITRLSNTLEEYIQQTKYSSCVLMVDDGSTDNSLEAIEKVCEAKEDFNYIAFEKNRGLSMAIKAGFDEAKTPFVGYIDADLQTTPMDFDKLLEFKDDFALVTGIRQDRQDSFIKKTSSKIANGFRRMMVHDGIEDTGCPLKVFETEIAQKLPFFKGYHRFFPALILMFEKEVKQVPVRHFPREAGEAKFGLRNRLVAPFLDCFGVRWLKKRHRNYQLKNNN